MGDLCQFWFIFPLPPEKKILCRLTPRIYNKKYYIKSTCGSFVEIQVFSFSFLGEACKEFLEIYSFYKSKDWDDILIPKKSEGKSYAWKKRSTCTEGFQKLDWTLQEFEDKYSKNGQRNQPVVPKELTIQVIQTPLV